MSLPLNAPLRASVTSIERQQILAVAEVGLGDPSVIPMWYGESDLSTPSFICDVVDRQLAKGDTFYTHKRGTESLRSVLKTYLDDLYSVDLDPDRLSITSSGMTAIMLCLQCIIDAGDNGVVVNPVWPNAQSAIRSLGGSVRYASLTADQGVWSLDLNRIYDQCDERTKVIFVNSPSNPTGWVMPDDQIIELLSFCRDRGIWLIADEVYHRMDYEGRAAPSFILHARDDDPVLVINSFSKAWAMTGWRIGWLVHPTGFGDVLGNMIEFNYSCVPPFLQEAAATALRDGEGFVTEMVEYCRRGRDIVTQSFASIPQIVDYSPPTASFYGFFRIDGQPDTLPFAQDLVRRAKIGIAPGTAFGPGAEDWYRICFALKPESLSEAMDRLRKALA